MISFEINKNPFETLQRLTLYPNPLTEFEERPWFGRKSGCCNRLNSRNLVLFHGHRNLTAANNSNHTWGYKNCQAIVYVKLAKYIAREQRCVYFSYLSTPGPFNPISGKQGLIPFSRQLQRRRALPPRPDLQGVPALEIRSEAHWYPFASGGLFALCP